tara:strand:+ start:182 stop:478 length:297 start_codon:yes stop_codon:yes gene_type:complete
MYDENERIAAELEALVNEQSSTRPERQSALEEMQDILSAMISEFDGIEATMVNNSKRHDRRDREDAEFQSVSRALSYRLDRHAQLMRELTTRVERLEG